MDRFLNRNIVTSSVGDKRAVSSIIATRAAIGFPHCERPARDWASRQHVFTSGEGMRGVIEQRDQSTLAGPDWERKILLESLDVK